MFAENRSVTTLQLADYRIARLHLRYALHHMRRLIATSPDGTTKALIEVEFRELQRRCREYARCQCGVLERN
jgi:hypothetical protein